MYQYNGKEKQDELGLEWLDYGARMYQPEIGRWVAVDRKSDIMPEYSCSIYALNNPIVLLDPDGEFPIIIHVRSFASFSTFGARIWGGDGRGFSTNASYTSRLRQETAYETTTRKYRTAAVGSPEAFVDIGGIRVFIGVAPANFGPNTGPFGALWGDGKAPMANLFGKFHVDKDGKLLGVIDYDGNVISVEDWNKRFEQKSTTNEDTK